MKKLPVNDEVNGIAPYCAGTSACFLFGGIQGISWDKWKLCRQESSFFNPLLIRGINISYGIDPYIGWAFDAMLNQLSISNHCARLFLISISITYAIKATATPWKSVAIRRQISVQVLQPDET